MKIAFISYYYDPDTGGGGIAIYVGQNIQEYLENFYLLIATHSNSSASFPLLKTHSYYVRQMYASVPVFLIALVCLEAMAAGRAVIGSIASSMVEMFNTDSVGRLVSSNCPYQITQSTI
jgi:hypothetical protein